MGYSQFQDVQPPPPKEDPKPIDRSDKNFVVLVPSGHSTEQKKHLPPAGPYHVNHFICHFKVKGKTYTDAQGEKIARRLTYHFLRHFCFIFSEQNIARAQYGRPGLDAFGESKTVEFTIGGNFGTAEHRAMGLLHPDWVVMSGASPVTIADLDDVKVIELTSFHGDTVKRRWNTAVEEVIIEGIAKVATVSDLKQYLYFLLFPSAQYKYLSLLNYVTNYARADKLLQFNRQHFLAGTRSWRVGYDKERGEFFVETIAIERYS